MSGARSAAVAICVLVCSVGTRPTAAPQTPRWFPDRPVAWFEHDDRPVEKAPARNHIQEWDVTLLLRDSVANEIDRALALEGRRPALDVNALDEVPCSTWFCARNHLRALTPEEVAAGPPAEAPQLPLTIVKGKDEGASAGFQVKDAAGRKFMLKMDPAGNLGLETSGEMVGSRLFYAAGYNVPAAFLLRLAPDQLKLAPHATFQLYGVQTRPLKPDRVDAMLARVAHETDGRIRAVAVPWIEGELLGATDLIGLRKDDPNDRLPHEDRRSLRANWVLYSWLSVFDAGAINTMDSYVQQDGRRFVRHYVFDFGCSFGSATSHAQSPRQDGEYSIEFGRSLRALVSLGLYHRPFQDERQRWAQLSVKYPQIGYYPADGYDPANHRANRKSPSHIRMTDRDAYWGAKLVTAFTDEQLAAVVATAELPAEPASYLLYALKMRRDLIGLKYLRGIAAVEDPTMSTDGTSVCFRDVALARGYETPAATRYLVEVQDGTGRRLLSTALEPRDGGACVPVGGMGPGTGYRIVRVSTRLGEPDGGGASRDTKAARVHLRWRASEQRFVVVGLERDE